MQIQGPPGIRNEIETKHAGLLKCKPPKPLKSKAKRERAGKAVSIGVITTSEFASKIDFGLAPLKVVFTFKQLMETTGH